MPRKRKEPEKRPRRKYGTGTVVLRKDRGDKSWQYSYTVNGKRITGYAESYEDADRLVLAAIALAKKLGRVPERLTVGDYLTKWIEGRTGLSENTRYRWGLTIQNRIIPAIGNIELRNLTRKIVQDQLVDPWIAEGLNPNSIRRGYLAPLSAACIDAIRDDLIERNPCEYIRYPKPERILDEDDEEEGEQVVYTIEQAKLLLSQLKGHWARRVILLIIALGLRSGEAKALKWRDVDFEAGKVRVRRNLSQLPGATTEGPTKTKSGRRTLSIPKFALVELREHKAEQNVLRLQAGKRWKNLDLVFCQQEDGDYIGRTALWHALNKATKDADLPRITPHGLRHNAGSILLALGIDPATVARILGHANPGITLSIYSHMLPGNDEEAMNRYNAAW